LDRLEENLNNLLDNRYNVGIYVRLSREDEEKEFKESESIKNQKDFLVNFCLEKGWNLKDIYVDDGFTGTNFDRPGFNKLIKDIESKKINLVITKDLSRLGRNYSKTGYYIDEYFPEHGVRYIAVNDNVDTKEESFSSTSAFMGVVNDIYAKDISKKVRTAFYTLQKKGVYLGTTAPFGYMKDKENKGKLVIDPNSSVIVKRIFREFLSGKTIKKIAFSLTKDGIKTPSEYAGIKNTQRVIKGAWNDVTVRRILTNEVYIGNMVQNKKKKVNYKVKKQVAVKKSEWIKIENTHEGIISKDDFYAVQSILSKRSYIPKKGKQHLLTGLIYCAKCGSRVTFVRRYENNKFYMLCNTTKNFRKLGKCDMLSFYEEDVNKIVIDKITKIANEYVNKEKIINNTFKEKMKNELDILEKEKQIIEKKIEKISKIKYELYKDKVSNKITYEMYVELNIASEKEKEELENTLILNENQIAKVIKFYNNDENLISRLKEFLEFKTIDRNILSNIIDKVTIYKNKEGEEKFNIYFKFKNPK
jgi:DNA invertase Pin-like site-specific DNA recombinase